jgi:hypothetical protein
MVISSESHLLSQVTGPRVTRPKERITMDEAPAASRCIPDLDDAAMSARLAAIEERLDEIIGRLDEIQGALLMMLTCTEP